MLKLCPQCSAEVVEQAQECFGCGFVFSDFVQERKKEQEIAPSRIAQTVDDIHPRALLLGQTVEDRFTVQERMEDQGLWVLYRTVDQRDGRERYLQMGLQKHQAVRHVVDVIYSLGAEYYLPNVVDTGENPAPFFIFDPMEGRNLLEWKKESPSMKQRLDFCGQVLHMLSQFEQRGVGLGKWDMSKFFAHDHGFLWIHPTLLMGIRQGDSLRVLEWIYWMLCDRIQKLDAATFVLSGLSIRYAQWLRMMVRRKASIQKVFQSWSKEQEVSYAMDAMRSRQLQEGLVEEFVFCDHGKAISFDLMYACTQHLVFGTIDCHEGRVIGYVDRVILAWEGLYFDPDVEELEFLYRRLVLDEDIPLFDQEAHSFEQQLLRMKILYLLRLDWEEALAHVIARAKTFDEWMEINRFRVLYGVRKDNVVVPKPESVREHLLLSSFFYWFANDKNEGLLWFDEAVERVDENAFELFSVLEAHSAMFGIPSSDRYSELRELGLRYGLEDQLVLLERLEDRLGVVDEKWLSLCTYENTYERILWCSSRFSSQKERDELDQYGANIKDQLGSFSIEIDTMRWEEIEENERLLSQQIQWLTQIHGIRKLYRDEDFTFPEMLLPFSQEGILGYMQELNRQRKERRDDFARHDGYIIAVMMLLAIGIIWFQS